MKKALALLICILPIAISSFSQHVGPEAAKPPRGKNVRPDGFFTHARSYSHDALSGYDAYGDPPAWAWAQKLGGDGPDMVNAFVEAPNGGLYITGSFSGAITIGGGTYTSEGFQDLFVAKVDNAGSILWLRQFPAGAGEELSGQSIDRDEDGNLYLTGYFTGSTAALGTALSTERVRAAFLAKLDNTGNPLWAVRYDDHFAEQAGKKVKLLNSGGLLLLTRGVGNLGFLSRFNTDGLLIWEEPGLAVFQDFAVYGDELYLTGSIFQPVTLGNTTLDPGFAYESVFIVKADGNGYYEWATMIVNSDSGYSISRSIVASEGGCYVSGIYQGIAMFGPDITEEAPVPGIFIAKMDGNGDFSWASSGGNPAGSSSAPLMALDGQEDVLAIGELVSPLELGNGPTISGDKDSYWLKLDGASGEYLQAEAVDGEAFALGVTAGGKAIQAGSLYGDLDLRQITPANPGVEWSLQSEGNSGWARGYQESRLGIDAPGNAFFIGTFQYDFPAGAIRLFSCNQAGVVVKIDENGEVLWASSLEAEGGKVTITAGARGRDGNFLAAGDFSGIINTPFGSFPGDNSTFIARYSPGGALLSLATYSPSTVYGIEVDNSGNVLVSGTYTNNLTIGGESIPSLGNADAYLAKFSPELSLVWLEGIGGEGQEYIAFSAADGAGNIYFALEAQSDEFSAGGVSLSLQNGDGNIVLVKFTPDGNALWAKVFGGGDPSNLLDYDCWPVAIEADASGQVYMTGFIGPNNDFGGVQLANPLWEEPGFFYRYNWFISKLDAGGNVLWATTVSHRTWSFPPFQLAFDEEGNLYMGGQFRDTTFFLDGALMLTPEVRLQQYGLVAKFGANGALDWLKTIAGERVRVESVAVAGENKLIVGGEFFGTAVLDEDHAFQNTGYNLFLASTGSLATDANYLAPEYFSLAVSPNPFRFGLQVSLKLEEAQTVHFALFDTRGRMVQAFAPVDLAAAGPHTIDLLPAASLPQGMYFLQVKVGDVVTVEKVERM